MKVRKCLKTAWNYSTKKLPWYGLTKVQARRIIKGALATTICFILVLINPVDKKLGAASSVSVVLTASLHPGRRLGAQIYALSLSAVGVALALAYTEFTHFTASKLYDNTGSLQRALGLLAFYEVVMLAMVAYLRAVAPRLFVSGFIFFLIVHFSYFSQFPVELGTVAYTYGIPPLVTFAVTLAINVLVFPEFGSTYIGSTVTSALQEIQVCLYETTIFFGTADKMTPSKLNTELSNLLSKRKKIRSVLNQCQVVMLECTFEMSIAFMSPRELKPIVKSIKELTSTESALIVACELEYAVFGSRVDDEESQDTYSTAVSPNTDNEVKSRKPRSVLDMAKPQKEVSFADKDILLKFLQTVENPVLLLLSSILTGIDTVMLTLAKSYDVPSKYISLANVSQDIDLETVPCRMNGIQASVDDLNITVEELSKQSSELVYNIGLFDVIVKNALGQISREETDTTYLMPRDEYFLLSSFLLNFRETAIVVSNLLEASRQILEVRIKREQRGWLGKKIWFSIYDNKKRFSKFLRSGYSEPQEAYAASIIEKASVIDSKDIDDKDGPSPASQYTTPKQVNTSFTKRVIFNFRNFLADILDALGRRKEPLKSVFQTVFLVMLLSFPVFSSHMRKWFINIRGAWIGFIAMIAFETSVGATVYTLIARAILLVVGSAWGYALYVAGSMGTNPYVMTVMFAIAMIPFYYTMIVSPYAKSGTFSIVSCSLVPLSALRPNGISGTILDSFLKRVVALLIGGTVTVIVQATLFPKKARVLMRTELIGTLRLLQQMEIQLALGLDGKPVSSSLVVKSDKTFRKFMKKARNSLAIAEAYLDVTKQEPRLKGSFKEIQIIYREMFFVLYQIFDRFDSIRFMRQQYGSAVLTELSQHVYLYRRNVYAAMINLMRAIENALETKKPLPQFLPSARILHLRLVNKVRMVLIGDDRPSDDSSDEEEFTALENKKNSLTSSRRHRMLLKKYMGWSATSSALEEVIEYLEELVNLTKLLVGYNQFKYGFLSKPIHETWAEAALSMDLPRSDEGFQTSNDNYQYDDKTTQSLITTPTRIFALTKEEQEAMDELPKLKNQATLDLSQMDHHKNINNRLMPHLSPISPIASPIMSATHQPKESGHGHFHLPHLHFKLFSRDSGEASHPKSPSGPHSRQRVQTSAAPSAQPGTAQGVEKPQNQTWEKKHQDNDDEGDQIDDLPATMKRVISRRYSISSTHSRQFSKKRK